MKNTNLNLNILFVENPLTSSEFYSKILDAVPVQTSPTFVMFALTNGVMLGLWSKYTAEPSVKSTPGASEICFSAEDVDATYESWGKKGTTIAQKPTDMDFGRTFVALDPDGHRIRVYKLSEER